jgi:hypothetical protein
MSSTVVALVYSQFQAQKWKNCSEVCGDSKQSSSVLRQRVRDLRGRTFAQAMTAVTWSDIIHVKNERSSSSSLLVTSSKDGTVTFWTVDFDKTLLSVSFNASHRTEFGEIGVLRTYRVDTNVFFVFAGGVDGRVAALRVTWEAAAAAEVVDLGFVWDKADRAAVGVISVLQDSFLENGTLRLAFAKSRYLVISDIHATASDRVAILAKWTARSEIGSAIVDLQPVDSETGQQLQLVVSERGTAQMLTLHDDLAQSHLAEAAVDAIDVQNFKCHGAKR